MTDVYVEFAPPPPDPDETEHLVLVGLRAAIEATLVWRDQAACRGEHSDAFFPGRGEDSHVARMFCQRCPVAEQCLTYALDAHEKYGVWGGASERQRRRLRRARNLGEPLWP